jgi:hypothetical protein
MEWLRKRKREIETQHETSETLGKVLKVDFLMTGESHFQSEAAVN